MVRKSDLPIIKARKLRGGGHMEPVRPSLYCDQCGEQFSADPGDYFYLPDSHGFTCTNVECGENALRLVSRRVSFVDWAAA
jgi:glyoxylate utilization-related uncharacterized protein